MLLSRPLRILEVSEPNKDGVFIHVRGLLRHLLNSGHQVTYAYSSLRSSSQLEPLLLELQAAGAKSRELKITNSPGPRDVTAVVWLLWQIYTQKPDIVHGHSSKAGALVRLASFLLPSFVYIYTPHAYYSMNTRPLGLKIGYWWVELALASLATTINISRDERRFAINVLGLVRSKAMIAANPVDLVRFCPTNADRRRQLRGKWNIPASAIVFGTLARFSAQKDLGTFYRAAIRCAKVSADLHFIHLGAGKEIDLYKNEVARAGVCSQFTFIEYLADTEPFFACLDAFVITSRFEAGWPIVMLEALALGLPVVTTDFVGLSANDPADLSHAAVVPVGDDEKLAESMLSRADSLRVNKQETNHRSYVEAHFAPNVCYGKVEQLYVQLAASVEVI